MGTTIVAPVPFIIGSAVVPVQIIIETLLLKSPSTTAACYKTVLLTDSGGNTKPLAG